MKKFLSSLVIVLFAVTSSYAAAGFQEGAALKKTVEEALKLKHNTLVAVEGNIIKRISDDKYIFKDSTGMITVEIDDDVWAGQVVGANDKIEIQGELEKKKNLIIIDVDYVKKL